MCERKFWTGGMKWRVRRNKWGWSDQPGPLLALPGTERRLDLASDVGHNATYLLLAEECTQQGDRDHQQITTSSVKARTRVGSQPPPPPKEA